MGCRERQHHTPITPPPSTQLFAGSFRVSLFIDLGSPSDLGNNSGCFMIIRWPVSSFLYQWHHLCASMRALNIAISFFHFHAIFGKKTVQNNWLSSPFEVNALISPCTLPVQGNKFEQDQGRLRLVGAQVDKFEYVSKPGLGNHTEPSLNRIYYMGTRLTLQTDRQTRLKTLSSPNYVRGW